MRSTTDPHSTQWTRDSRNPVTLAQVGRLKPGLRYGLAPVDLGTDERGAHMKSRVRLRRVRRTKDFVQERTDLVAS